MYQMVGNCGEDVIVLFLVFGPLPGSAFRRTIYAMTPIAKGFLLQTHLHFLCIFHEPHLICT